MLQSQRVSASEHLQTQCSITRVVQMSDLHFGAVEKRAADALLQDVAALGEVDVLAICGDLTQRAHTQQFTEAVEYIQKILAIVGSRCALLITPGNHDVPLWNFMRRLTNPLGNYHHAIEPLYSAGKAVHHWSNSTVAIASAVSARRCSGRLGGFWKDGLLSSQRLSKPLAFLASSHARWRILMTHHPLAVHEPISEGEVVRGLQHCATAIRSTGVNMVLGGHLHIPFAMEVRGIPGVMYVASGTAISTRLRHTPNSYNVIELGETLRIHRRDFDGSRFRAVE